MTPIGWEFWGLKFAIFMIALVSAVFFLILRLWTSEQTKMAHVDMMAGDEGDDDNW
jgi:hypothetical protein